MAWYLPVSVCPIFISNVNVVMTSSSPHAASVRFRHFYPAASTVQLLDKQPRARARVGGNVERAVVRWL